LQSDLKASRCEAAKKFVFRLKEHSEAKTALEFLRNDVMNWNKMRGGVEFLEMEKLPAYGRL